MLPSDVMGADGELTKMMRYVFNRRIAKAGIEAEKRMRKDSNGS